MIHATQVMRVCDTLMVCDAINVFCEGTVTFVGTTFTISKKYSVAQARLHNRRDHPRATRLPLHCVLASPARGGVEQYFARRRGWKKVYLNSITTPQSFEKWTRHFSKSSSPCRGAELRAVGRREQSGRLRRRPLTCRRARTQTRSVSPSIS